MTFAAYLAAGSSSECQIQNSTRNLCWLVAFDSNIRRRCLLKRDANVRIGPLALALSDHRSCCAQISDFLRRVAELREHLIGMFAEFRRHAAQRRLGAVEAHGEATPLYQSFSMISPRYLVCSLASALSMDCTGPAGRPAASRRRHSGSLSCCLRIASSSARNASRCSTRSRLRAKRGSVPSSGLPSSLHSLRKVASLPTPMKIFPSRAANTA